MKEISNKAIRTATKWSFISEISAKFVVPITNMILARILAPEAFGIIATINMVISFADMLSNAGFQKYLIQKSFENEEELNKNINVAFWTNLFLSVTFWIIILIFNDGIASLVGSPGYGFPIVIACLILPITSFSSIQEALFSRNLDYKVLFYNRSLAIILPFVITIPLALMGFNYWSLIIGSISGNLGKAILLTYNSKWKPKLYYDLEVLKTMFSFSMWTILESITMWLTTWIDIFIISSSFDTYYVGLYKNSQAMVTGVLSVITTATTGVLFTSLSRVQNNHKSFCSIYKKFQLLTCVFVLPLGVGIFLFSDFVTLILLGPSWLEASFFVGIWGFSTSIVASYGTFCREAYRAKGVPKVSLFVQIMHLIFVIPCCLFAINYGFVVFCFVRSITSLQIIVLHYFIMPVIIRVKRNFIFSETLWPVICSLLMGCFGILMKTISDNYIWQFFVIFLCILIYFILLFTKRKYRNIVFNMQRGRR